MASLPLSLPINLLLAIIRIKHKKKTVKTFQKHSIFFCMLFR